MILRVFWIIVLVAGLCVASPSSAGAFPPSDEEATETETGTFLFKFHINFWSAQAKVGETYNGVDIYSVPCKTTDAKYAAATHCSVCGLEGERALPGLEDCGHTSEHGAGHITHDNFDTTLCFNPEFQSRDVSAGHDNYGNVPHEINKTPNIIKLFDGPGAFYGEYDQNALRVDNWQWAVPLWLYKQDNCHKHTTPDPDPDKGEEPICVKLTTYDCCEEQEGVEGCPDTDPDPDDEIPPPGGVPLLACNAGDGFRGAADDVLRVNISERLIAEHGNSIYLGYADKSVPADVMVPDLTVEARWKLSQIKGNDDVPTGSKIRIGTVSTQGHRLFIDNDAQGGPEIVYRPKRWASGFDRFVYAYPDLECAATVTIVFTDSLPVSIPVFDVPDETVNSVFRYSWIKADGETHRHARRENRIRHVTTTFPPKSGRCENPADHFTRPDGGFDYAAFHAECAYTYPEPYTVVITEEVEDLYRWAYPDSGVRRNVDVQHFSGRFRLFSGASYPYRYPSDGSGSVPAPYDYDADLWHGGYLYHDPETGVLPPLEGDHGALSGFLLTRDVTGPAGGDIVWRYINYPGTPGGNQTRDIIRNAVTFDGVHPVSPGIVRPSPRFNHLEYHQNLRPPGHRVHVVPEEYTEGWYYRRDRHHPTRWHDQCGDLPGSADTKTQICLIARNSQPDQVVSDELTDDGVHVTVRYWVCDRRVEAYWADRAAANAEGFDAYDYCSRNTHTVGFVPQPAQLFPN